MSLLLAIADGVLGALHLAVVLGNLTLWAFRRTRRLHLLLVAVTAFSWFVLGAIYGLGYCFLTDWQARIQRARGITDIHHSFLHYLAQDVLHLPVSKSSVDLAAGIGFATVIVLSVALALRDAKVRPRP